MTFAPGQSARQRLHDWQRADELPLRQRVTAFVLLLLIYFVYAWAFNTVDVLRPYIAHALDLSLGEAGSIYSAQALGALIGAIVNGQLADRLGRRNLLLVVSPVFGLLLLANAIVASYALLLAERFLLGYFLGAMYPITVGLYVTLFAPGVRGRLAGLALGVYNAAVACLGAAGALVLDRDWRILLYVGIVPVLLTPLVWLLLPDDRRLIPHGGQLPNAADTPRKLPMTELFAPAVRRQTLLLVLLSGLNFFAYQAFTGWATTYLKTDRALDGAAVGAIVSWQFWGSCAGAFFWGWLADRLGRRIGAAGFVVAALAVLVYLRVPSELGFIAACGFVYGLGVSASVVWGPWLTELYPPHLRSTAASLYHWGRMFSFFAPLITAALVQRHGFTASMHLASLCFVFGALIWIRLPETVASSGRSARHEPGEKR